MRTIVLATLLLLSFCLPAAGQKASQHPIDRTLTGCLATSKGNMPRAECYSKAAEAWEKDIDTTYHAIIGKLTSKGEDSAELKKRVESAQTAWEQFRDAEFSLFFYQYGNKRGTGYLIPRITMRIDVMKPRALQLEALLAQY